MKDTNLSKISDLEKFVAGIPENTFSSANKEETYEWVKNILNTFAFRNCKKKERGKIRKYVQTVTGYSVSQITRLVEKYLLGELAITPYKRNSFTSKYSPHDIALLCTTDNAHSRLNGNATKKILEREYTKFGHMEYANISKISVPHLYRLRATRIYQSKSLTYTHTQAVKRNIGERRKPTPNGSPGYIRIDTVHQGDSEKKKGVYHINSVDEVTQWEIVASVEQITEGYLEPILLLMIEQYPFIIIEFHADNGSEYINYTIADLLNKLLIKLTKSRSRHSNDNALVESKNGSIIRKHMGYFYIHQKYATEINDFYVQFFNPYLNFHRPCGFATTTTDGKGKQKKKYDLYQTPYEALRKVTAVEFLKPGVTFTQLDTLSKHHSDNESATIMEQEKQKLFEKIRLKPIDI
jgi:hypothetical protein